MKRFLVVGLLGFACSGDAEDGGAPTESTAGAAFGGSSSGGVQGAGFGGSDPADFAGRTHAGAGMEDEGRLGEGGTAPFGGAGSAGGATEANGGAGATAGAGSSGEPGVGGDGGRDSCPDCTSGPPRVLLLLDSSSSMFEPRDAYWDAAYEALMAAETGAVALFQDRIEFGFAAFRGAHEPLPEEDPMCAEIHSVPFALENRKAIDRLYANLGGDYTLMTKWETPTPHAIRRVVADFVSGEPSGRRYLVLITDGHPNTCAVLDPQCGQDHSIRAVQDARALGITTLVLGFGDILDAQALCDPNLARCGAEHLQDIANAGVGWDVEPPPPAFLYTPCVLRDTGALLATYAAEGAGGSARFYSASGAAGLRAELASMFGSIVAGELP